MFKFNFFIVLLLLSLSYKSLSQKKDSADQNIPPVSIPGTQQLKIKSSIVANQEYILHVNLPRYYTDTTKRFPIVYLLDSQWDFPLLNAVYGEQYYDGFVPEVIVVGITWGGENPNYDQLRARDFTPPPSTAQSPQQGNAANFLSFIKNELTPFIESKYRIRKNERTLIGSSLGGLFTLYALYKETAFFQNYILTSPATQWNNEIIFKIEKEYSDKNKNLPIRLYMAMGDLEPLDGFNKLISTLKSRQYKGLNLQTKVLENTGHSGTKPEGYTRGLQWVFKRPSLALTTAQLMPYVGTYSTQHGPVKVTLEKNGLVVIAGEEKIKFVAETDLDFYHPGAFLFLHFKKDNKNKVIGAQLETFGGEAFAKKID